MAGTFLFFFVGIGAAVALGSAVDPAAGLIVVALAHGIVLAVLVSALGAVSGGHFNPAVTFGVWLGGHIPWRRGIAYVLAQLIGAILAAWLIGQLLPQSAGTTLGTPALGSGVTPLAGIVIEAVITLILVTVVFGTAIDPRAHKVGGLAIGLALAAGILMAGPLTGGAANPARWFGPAAVTALWDNWYVWVIGPLLGGGIAALAYRYLFLPQPGLTQTPAEPTA
jgi:MIP family channel proteins